MQIEILVDADAVWPRVEEDLLAATESIRVQSLSFALDGVGTRLVGAMERAKAPDRRILADSFYTLHKIDDRFAWHPRQLLDAAYRSERRASIARIHSLSERGIDVRLTNPCGFLFSKGFLRNHKKLVVVDERIAYLGGMNFTDHNFAWHDMMLRLEGQEVADWLARDFDVTWDGRNLAGSQCFDGLEVQRLDGRSNPKELAPLFARIAAAKRSLDVVCPYVSFPFFDPLARAADRGVRVRLLVPEFDNWGLFSEYASHVARRSGIELLVYPDRMLHLKAMLIDDEVLIAGSANFYFVSHDFMQEYVVTIQDPGTIDQFRRLVRDVDFARARTPSQVASWRGRYAEARLRLLSGVARALPR